MKQFTLKSYSGAGTFLGYIQDFQIAYFYKRINSGQEDLSVIIPSTIDNFNTDGLVTLGNKLELWITDEDSPTTLLKIYTGYIEQQKVTVDGGSQMVEILCLGIGSKLTMDVLKSGSQTQLYSKTSGGLSVTLGDLSDTEIAVILTAIIDLYRVNNPLMSLSYTLIPTVSIATSGNKMTYTFQAMTYAAALKKCIDAAPQNWNYYIDQNEVFKFRGISSTPDHTFVVGKHISKLTVEKGIDSARNIALIWDGDVTYKQYKDDGSVGTYGRRVQQISDPQIGVATTIDNFGANFLAQNKDARIRAVIEIIDNNENAFGYDIESIEPGQTCKITGISDDSDLLGNNMVITEVQWYPDHAQVTLETREDFDINKFLIEMGKKIEQQSLTLLPPSYT